MSKKYDVSIYRLGTTVETGKALKEAELCPNAKAGLEAVIDLKSATEILKNTEKNHKGLSVEKAQELNGSHDIRLIHVKGQRRIQYYLIKPDLTYFNTNDCYIIVVPNQVYVWIGRNASVMKKAKANEAGTYIQKYKEYNCICRGLRIIDDFGKNISNFIARNFKNGTSSNLETKIFVEDTQFENFLTSHNMVFDIVFEDTNEDNPKIVLNEFQSFKSLKKKNLDSLNAYLFDFGSEVYLWFGSKFSISKRQPTLSVAMDFFNNRLKIDFTIPKTNEDMLKYGYYFPNYVDDRPSWTTFEKLSERCETVLFKRKFIDWPDITITGVQKKNTSLTSLSEKCNINIQACFDEDILSDFIIDGMVINRGFGGVDPETGFFYSVTTMEVTVHRMVGNTFQLIPDEIKSIFFSAEAYLILWKFIYKRADVLTLKGESSMFDDSGKEVSFYFYWQGVDCTVTEMGFSAFLTAFHVKREEHQLRVVQNEEFPAFVSIFNGKYIVNIGKMDDFNFKSEHLYIMRGLEPCETYFVEVEQDSSSIRSLGNFFLIIPEKCEIVIFKNRLYENNYAYNESSKIFNSCFGCIFCDVKTFNTFQTSVLKKYIKNPDSLKFSDDVSPIKFCCHFKLINWQNIECQKIYSHYQSTKSYDAKGSKQEGFSITQNHIYGLIQPALVLVCTKNETILWHGWKSDDFLNCEEGEKSTTMKDHNFIRLREKVVENLFKFLKLNDFNSELKAVHAGIEPDNFIQLFPWWKCRKDISKIQDKSGKCVSSEVILETSISQKDLYHYKDLLVRPLPDNVNPLKIEFYLYEDEFKEIFKMTKEEYSELPEWKKLELKKQKKLF